MLKILQPDMSFRAPLLGDIFGDRFSGFDQHFAAQQEKTLNEQQYTSSYKEPFYFNDVGYRSEYKHSQGHHGSRDHS
ncbi:Uncharacterised protein [Chlamydia trachomatis]|nr:Uncharacterised protein [Chlamydia trachomatis]